MSMVQCYTGDSVRYPVFESFDDYDLDENLLRGETEN